MSFQFATCERGRALQFLRTEQADLEDSLESVGPLLDLIEADVVRITDPDYHTLMVVPGKNWDEDRRADVVKAAGPIEHKYEHKEGED